MPTATSCRRSVKELCTRCQRHLGETLACWIKIGRGADTAFRTTLTRGATGNGGHGGREVFTMQRRLAVMTGVVTLGFAGVLGLGSSAAAAETAQMSAQSGAFYAYEHDDFNGRSAIFTATDRDLSDNSWVGQSGRNVNDNISSMKNQTDRDISLYNNIGCTGDRYVAKKHSEDKDLTDNSNNPSFDNKTSCVQFG